MRIFQTFPEMLSEVQRDLAELGTVVQRSGWQGKSAADAGRDRVKELRNYSFTVKNPSISSKYQMPKVTQPWADSEFYERIRNKSVNHGLAYKHRPEVWEELMEGGQFSYTYGERLNGRMGYPNPLQDLIHSIALDPTTRRAFLPVYQPGDTKLGQNHRVPCTLGYHFEPVGNKLHMTYMMRSSDFTTHFQNDLYLAVRLLDHVVQAVNEEMNESFFSRGEFTFFSVNLHVFERDVQGVF